MRTSLSLIGAIWLATCSTGARADTIYKCVDASGKAAYTNLPCGKERKVSKEFSVDAPRTDARSSAAQDSEQRRLQLAEEQFRQRQAVRERAYESEQQEVQMQERNEARAARQRQLAAEAQERDVAAQAALRKERRCNANPKGPGC